MSLVWGSRWYFWHSQRYMLYWERKFPKYSAVLFYALGFPPWLWLSYTPVCLSVLQTFQKGRTSGVSKVLLLIYKAGATKSLTRSSRLTECLKKDFITDHLQAVQQVVSWVSITRDEQSHPLQKYLPNLLPLALTDVCFQSSSLILFSFPSEN